MSDAIYILLSLFLLFRASFEHQTSSRWKKREINQIVEIDIQSEGDKEFQRKLDIGGREKLFVNKNNRNLLDFSKLELKQHSIFDRKDRSSNLKNRFVLSPKQMESNKTLNQMKTNKPARNNTKTTDKPKIVQIDRTIFKFINKIPSNITSKFVNNFLSTNMTSKANMKQNNRLSINKFNKNNLTNHILANRTENIKLPFILNSKLNLTKMSVKLKKLASLIDNVKKLNESHLTVKHISGLLKNLFKINKTVTNSNVHNQHGFIKNAQLNKNVMGKQIHLTMKPLKIIPKTIKIIPKAVSVVDNNIYTGNRKNFDASTKVSAKSIRDTSPMNHTKIDNVVKVSNPSKAKSIGQLPFNNISKTKNISTVQPKSQKRTAQEPVAALTNNEVSNQSMPINSSIPVHTELAVHESPTTIDVNHADQPVQIKPTEIPIVNNTVSSIESIPSQAENKTVVDNTVVDATTPVESQSILQGPNENSNIQTQTNETVQTANAVKTNTTNNSEINVQQSNNNNINGEGTTTVSSNEGTIPTNSSTVHMAPETHANEHADNSQMQTPNIINNTVENINTFTNNSTSILDSSSSTSSAVEQTNTNLNNLSNAFSAPVSEPSPNEELPSNENNSGASQGVIETPNPDNGSNAQTEVVNNSQNQQEQTNNDLEILSNSLNISSENANVEEHGSGPESPQTTFAVLSSPISIDNTTQLENGNKLLILENGNLDSTGTFHVLNITDLKIPELASKAEPSITVQNINTTAENFSQFIDNLNTTETNVSQQPNNTDTNNNNNNTDQNKKESTENKTDQNPKESTENKTDHIIENKTDMKLNDLIGNITDQTLNELSVNKTDQNLTESIANKTESNFKDPNLLEKDANKTSQEALLKTPIENVLSSPNENEETKQLNSTDITKLNETSVVQSNFSSAVAGPTPNATENQNLTNIDETKIDVNNTAPSEAVNIQSGNAGNVSESTVKEVNNKSSNTSSTEPLKTAEDKKDNSNTSLHDIANISTKNKSDDAVKVKKPLSKNKTSVRTDKARLKAKLAVENALNELLKVDDSLSSSDEIILKPSDNIKITLSKTKMKSNNTDKFKNVMNTKDNKQKNDSAAHAIDFNKLRQQAKMKLMEKQSNNIEKQTDIVTQAQNETNIQDEKLKEKSAGKDQKVSAKEEGKKEEGDGFAPAPTYPEATKEPAKVETDKPKHVCKCSKECSKCNKDCSKCNKDCSKNNKDCSKCMKECNQCNKDCSKCNKECSQCNKDCSNAAATKNKEEKGTEKADPLRKEVNNCNCCQCKNHSKAIIELGNPTPTSKALFEIESKLSSERQLPFPTIRPTTRPTVVNYKKLLEPQCKNGICGVEGFCKDKKTGTYPNHNDCQKYWICVGGRTYPARCPEGLVFNYKIFQCDDRIDIPMVLEDWYWATCNTKKSGILKFRKKTLLKDKNKLVNRKYFG